jgi:hypothetical protein
MKVGVLAQAANVLLAGSEPFQGRVETIGRPFSRAAR